MNLFPSTIIIYKNSQSAQEKINEITNQLKNEINPNNPDIYTISKDSGWTIEQTRKLKKFFSQKPFNHQNKIGIIYQAENLNQESQNALLKTLEEPGKNNYLILTTKKTSKILPTILSRCHPIRLRNNTEEVSNSEIFISTDFKKDILKLDKFYRNKDDIKPFLEEQLQLKQQELIKNPNKKNSQSVKKLIKSLKIINNNVDPKSALDFFLLS